MPDIAVEDRRATRAEVREHRLELLRLLSQHGLRNPRLRDDGALVVDSAQAGYWPLAEFSAAAEELVGAHVYVLTGDVPGARGVVEQL